MTYRGPLTSQTDDHASPVWLVVPPVTVEAP